MNNEDDIVMKQCEIKHSYNYCIFLYFILKESLIVTFDEHQPLEIIKWIVMMYQHSSHIYFNENEIDCLQCGLHTNKLSTEMCITSSNPHEFHCVHRIVDWYICADSPCFHMVCDKCTTSSHLQICKFIGYTGPFKILKQQTCKQLSNNVDIVLKQQTCLSENNDNTGPDRREEGKEIWKFRIPPFDDLPLKIRNEIQHKIKELQKDTLVNIEFLDDSASALWLNDLRETATSLINNKTMNVKNLLIPQYYVGDMNLYYIDRENFLAKGSSAPHQYNLKCPSCNQVYCVTNLWE